MSAQTPLYSSAEAARTLSQSQTLSFVNNRPAVLREGIFLASIPYSYDLRLLTALRQRDDGRDQKLVDWLVKKLSFVELLPISEEEGIHYRMEQDERELLQKYWLESEPDAYIEAHKRALTFWGNYPTSDPFIQKQNTLYHLMIINPIAGIHLLARTFRQYANQRHLAAIDRLLDVAKDARSFLAFKPNLPVLDGSRGWNLTYLDSWLHYLHARLAQLRQKWLESEPAILMLLENNTLPKVLYPYVVRAYALVLCKKGQYVEAIKQFEFAIQAFGRQLGMEDEQGYTMISLGDTYVELAIAARGDRTRLVPLEVDWQERLGGLFYLPLVLPLVVYLSLLGINLRHPRSWPTLQKHDWIIARLFGHATKWYQEANDLLEAIPGRSEWWGRPEEKLAWIYLQLGEAQQAKRFFEEMLTDDISPLSEYTMAIVQTGLARSWLQLGKPFETLSLINKALPVLEKYENLEFQAQAYQLLAETYIVQNLLEEAIPYFEQALKAYQALNDLVGATDVVERLQEIQDEAQVTVNQEQVSIITNIAQQLPVREYLVGFQHPALVLFRRVMMMSLAALLFVFLIQTAPLESTEYTNMPGQGNSILDLSLLTDYSVIFQVLLFLLDLFAIALLYTLLGVYMIARTEWSTVQTITRSKAVRISKEGITVGYRNPENVGFIRWIDVTHFVIADMYWWLRPMRNHAGMLLASEQQQLIIQANVTWYDSLKRQVTEWLAARQDQGEIVHRANLSYTLLRSKMGLFYGLGLLLVIGLAIAFEHSPTRLEQAIFGSRYSILDLYPYVFLALFLPPIWWSAIRPLHMLARLGRHEPLRNWVLRLGIAIGLLRLLTYSKPWFSDPDIYPSLAILLWLGSAIASFWWATDPVVPAPSMQQKTDEPHPMSDSDHKERPNNQKQSIWVVIQQSFIILLIICIILGALLRLV